MPGYGRAGKPKDFGYSIDGYASTWRRCWISSASPARISSRTTSAAPWALAWAARHPGALASATLINSGVGIGYRWHHYARIWRTPILGEVFQATASRPAFRLLL